MEQSSSFGSVASQCSVSHSDDFHVPSTSHHQNRNELPKLSQICDRFNITDRVGAAIATAVLEDFGLVTSFDKTHVIDK